MGKAICPNAKITINFFIARGSFTDSVRGTLTIVYETISNNAVWTTLEKNVFPVSIFLLKK